MDDGFDRYFVVVVCRLPFFGFLGRPCVNQLCVNESNESSIINHQSSSIQSRERARKAYFKI